MRKGIAKLTKLTVTKGPPLALITATIIFVKNKVKGVKEPVTLDQSVSKDSDRRILVVGGGISGLSTAYFLTQDARNKVTLCEKDRKCGMGSSSHNGGIFLTNDFEPWTDRSILKILPGLFTMTGPQCAWAPKFFREPGASKFLYYYLLQG